MLLSVLIPLYNAEEFIENSLKSVLNQDLPLSDFEILLMDDGSTDSSCEIIQRYTKDHSHVFFYKNPKKGVYSARNELLKLARGTYVYFLDSDDYIAENSIKYLLQIAFQSDLDLVAFKTDITSIVKPFQISSDLLKTKDVKLMSGEEFIATYRDMRHEVWWYFIRKELLKELDLVFDEMLYSADVLFTLQLFLKSKKVGFLPLKIHRYIQTENSIIRSKNVEKMIGVVHCQVQMIKDVSRLIQEVDNEHSKGDLKHNLLKNLRFRRDHHLFVAIRRMIQAKLPYYEIKDILHNLRAYNAYPLKTYHGKECESLKLRLMVFIINNQLLLRPAIYVYNFLEQRRSN